MSLLKEGISCDRNEPFARFKSACFEASRVVGGEPSEFHAPDVTPNFYFSIITEHDCQTSVLCNLAYPIIAFALSGSNFPCEIEFVESPELARAFENCDYRCPAASELNRKLSEVDLAALRDSERRDILYWKPGSVGEVIFNHWD